MKKQPSDSIREYMSIIGKKGGEKLKQMRGKEYYKEIRKKGTQKPKSQWNWVIHRDTLTGGLSFNNMDIEHYKVPQTARIKAKLPHDDIPVRGQLRNTTRLVIAL